MIGVTRSNQSSVRVDRTRSSRESELLGTRVLRHLRTEDSDIWAQLISMRLKPGREDDLPTLPEHLRAAEQPGSGLLRSTAMRDQNDPSRVYMFVVRESEEKARDRDNDPRRQEGLQAGRALMAEIFDGAPEFVDLTIVDEMSV
jgi:hypothetical protein